MVRYEKYQYKGNIQGANGKYFIRLKASGETYGIAELAEHMANHSTSFTKGEMMGILTDMVSCVRELLLDGKKVKIEDLAIFSLGCQSGGVADPKQADANLIKRVYINARGTGEFQTREIGQKVKLKEQDVYSRLS